MRKSAEILFVSILISVLVGLAVAQRYQVRQKRLVEIANVGAEISAADVALGYEHTALLQATAEVVSLEKSLGAAKAAAADQAKRVAAAQDRWRRAKDEGKRLGITP